MSSLVVDRLVARRLSATKAWKPPAYASGGAPTKGEDGSASGLIEVMGNQVALHAVFDGHGGAGAAQLCAQEMAQWIQDAAGEVVRSDPHAVMEDVLSQACRDAFDTANEAICDAFPSAGTTATVALIFAEGMVVANVGDSSACLVVPGQGKLTTVTDDHRVDRLSDEERQRVLHCGGILSQATGQSGQAVGPLRLYPGGLMMTRSLGDADAGRVVIPDPAVHFYPRPPADVMLLIASDGVWDFVDLGRVARLVSLGMKPAQGVRWLVRAMIVAVKERPDADDDVTLTAVHIKGVRAGSLVRGLSRSVAKTEPTPLRTSHLFPFWRRHNSSNELPSTGQAGNDRVQPFLSAAGEAGPQGKPGVPDVAAGASTSGKVVSQRDGGGGALATEGQSPSGLRGMAPAVTSAGTPLAHKVNPAPLGEGPGGAVSALGKQPGISADTAEAEPPSSHGPLRNRDVLSKAGGGGAKSVPAAYRVAEGEHSSVQDVEDVIEL